MIFHLLLYNYQVLTKLIEERQLFKDLEKFFRFYNTSKTDSVNGVSYNKLI